MIELCNGKTSLHIHIHLKDMGWRLGLPAAEQMSIKNLVFLLKKKRTKSYLQESCTRSSQSPFQHCWGKGSTHPSPSWRPLGSWWLLVNEKSIFSKDWIVSVGGEPNINVYIGNMFWTQYVSKQKLKRRNQKRKRRRTRESHKVRIGIWEGSQGRLEEDNEGWVWSNSKYTHMKFSKCS